MGEADCARDAIGMRRAGEGWTCGQSCRDTDFALNSSRKNSLGYVRQKVASVRTCGTLMLQTRVRSHDALLSSDLSGPCQSHLLGAILTSTERTVVRL